LATFHAKDECGQVITIIEKISIRRAGAFDNGNARIKALSAFVRADNHNAMKANEDRTEFTDVRTGVVYRRV
jgi:hypothetical protein